MWITCFVGLLALAAQPAAAQTVAGKPAPYVLIHKDGYRIDAMDKPVREGGEVRIRLAPQGLLTILPESAIDWAATEKYNAQAQAAATPAPAPEPPMAEEGGGGPVIEKKIVGTKISASLDSSPGPAGEQAGEGEGSGAAAKPAPGSSKPADPNAAADARVAMAKEMEVLRKAIDSAQESRSQLEAQIAALQAKVVNEPPPSGVQEYESPSRKALAAAEASLATVTQKLQALEARLSELGYEEAVAPPAPAPAEE